MTIFHFTPHNAGRLTHIFQSKLFQPSAFKDLYSNYIISWINTNSPISRAYSQRISPRNGSTLISSANSNTSVPLDEVKRKTTSHVVQIERKKKSNRLSLLKKLPITMQARNNLANTSSRKIVSEYPKIKFAPGTITPTILQTKKPKFSEEEQSKKAPKPVVVKKHFRFADELLFKPLPAGSMELDGRIYKKDDFIKTNARATKITYQMVGFTIHIHNGKQYFPVKITEEMIGHRLGEFSITKKRAVWKKKDKR